MLQCLFRLWRLAAKNSLDPLFSPFFCHFLLQGEIRESFFTRLSSVLEPHTSQQRSPDLVEICQDVLVEMFEGMANPFPPSVLIESLKSGDWRASYQVYIEWIYDQTNITAEELIAGEVVMSQKWKVNGQLLPECLPHRMILVSAIRCMKFGDRKIDRSRIVQLIQRLDLQSLDIESATSLVEVSKSTDAHADLQVLIFYYCVWCNIIGPM